MSSGGFGGVGAPNPPPRISYLALAAQAVRAPPTPPKTAITPLTATKPKSTVTPIKDLRKSSEDMPGYRGFLKLSVGKALQLQTFDVHESLSLLARTSFKKAVSGNWVEAQDRLVKLPEDDPDTFNRCIHLLYTKNLAVTKPPSDKIFTGFTREDMELLARLYVLAEKLQDTVTKNIVLEGMILCAREHPNSLPLAHVVCIIYDDTPRNSPMRKLLVDLFTQRAYAFTLRTPLVPWPRDFLEDMSIQLVTKRLPAASDPIMTGGASDYVEGNEGAGL